MINITKIKPIISKEKIFEKLHIVEGTEAFKSADNIFEELSDIVTNNMKLTAVYKVTDSLNINFEESEKYKKYIICFISSDDNINEISHEMMSSGNYMKGYLLNEIAVNVIFRASNELNQKLRKQAAICGYNLSRSYAPGDGAINLNAQRLLLEVIKKETELNACLNEAQVLIPERSLLYMFGIMEGVGDSESCNSCSYCKNLNCQHREKQ